MSNSIGVVGAGAIGCYVGGLLAKQTPITMIGRPRQRETLGSHGLAVVPLSGSETTLAASDFTFATDAQALADCDTVLIAVKSAQTAEVANQIFEFVKDDALIVSLQNGVKNPKVLRETFSRVLATIVSFNVVIDDGDETRQKVRQTTSGPLIIESVDHGSANSDQNLTKALLAQLKNAGVASKLSDNIAAEQWSKLVINLSNAINALAGVSTREMLQDAGYRKIISAVAGEALDVLDVAKIRPSRMRGVPLRLLSRILTLPSPIVRLALRSRMKIDPRARSSMWQDLDRRRSTEVDYLNGEIVSLASSHQVEAPLNRRLVELVNSAVAANAGSPALSSQALLAELNL